MPRLIQPPGQPREVTTAIETIGNKARTEVLRRLSIDGPLTLRELAEAVGTTQMSAYRHLVFLEEAGLVTGDLPHGERAGRTVTWRVNAEAMRNVADVWLRYVSGQDA